MNLISFLTYQFGSLGAGTAESSRERAIRFTSYRDIFSTWMTKSVIFICFVLFVSLFVCCVVVVVLLLF